MSPEISPFVRSLTTYTFDLDGRLLTIKDLDYFSPGRDVTLSMGFTVKRIAKEQEEVSRIELRKVTSLCATPEEAFQASKRLPPEEAFLDLVEGALNFKIRHRLNVDKEGLLLALDYVLDIGDEGAKLLYCGSAQPSDYEGVRGNLRVADLSKEIRVVAQCKSPFSVRCFKGNRPKGYPPSIHGKQELGDTNGPYFARTSFKLDFEDWERSAYYSIAQD